MRIGITGYAESGKDATADTLVSEFGVVRVNMSDALNKYLCILNPIIAMTPSSTPGEHLAVSYSTYVEAVGLTEAKKFPEVRRLLQAFGTEVGRAIDPHMWVKQMELEATKHENVVTTGIRYLEEVEPLDHLVHVNRPGYGPLNDHSSEDLEHIFALADIRIENDGTLDDLLGEVRTLAEALRLQPTG